MKSKKVTMLAAALVVAVVALAGVGYAINYTAKTTNTNNTMESAYITMTQDTNSAAAYNEDFFSKIYFDTITEKKIWGTETEASVKTTYIPRFNAAIDVTNKTMNLSPTSGAANAAYVSNGLALNIAKTNTTADSVTLDVTVSNFTPITGLTYTMAIKSGNTVDMVNYATPEGETQSMWRFSGVNIDPTSPATSVQYEVYLFISMTDTTAGAYIIPGEGQNISTAGFNMPEGDPATTDSVFTFVATVSE